VIVGARMLQRTSGVRRPVAIGTAAPQMSDPGTTVDNGPVAADLLDDSANTGPPTNTPRGHDTMTTIEAFRKHLAAVDPRKMEVTHP
jgi:hypothetical protein